MDRSSIETLKRLFGDKRMEATVWLTALSDGWVECEKLLRPGNPSERIAPDGDEAGSLLRC